LTREIPVQLELKRERALFVDSGGTMATIFCNSNGTIWTKLLSSNRVKSYLEGGLINFDSGIYGFVCVCVCARTRVRFYNLCSHQATKHIVPHYLHVRACKFRIWKVMFFKCECLKKILVSIYHLELFAMLYCKWLYFNYLKISSLL